jgi:chloramphenicol 3-O-phosphotransferase
MHHLAEAAGKVVALTGAIYGGKASIARTVSGIAGRPVAVCFAAPPDVLSLG